MKCIEDEIPFDLPEGWAWARVSSIVQICLGLTHTPEYVEKGVAFYSVKDISSGGLDTSNPKYISEEEFENFPSGAKPQKGDILFGRVGTLGKPTVVEIEEPFGIFVSLGFFRKIYKPVSSEYIMNWMNSSLFWNQVAVNVKGAVLTNLNTGWLSRFLMPLPPISEQYKISDFTLKLIDKVNFISDSKEDLYQLLSDTKSKILDLAVRGKLVPQDPNDEPASVLLERIRAEKEELIKQGKIKRNKKESVIFKGDDNSYYCNIPDNWMVCSLKELFNVCSAKRVLQSEWKKSGVPFYRAREIVKLSDSGYVDNDLFISEDHYLKMKTEFGVPQAGDLMVSGVGTIGRVYVVKENDRFYYKDASVLCFENRTGAIAPQFARYELESNFMQSQMKENSKGTTVDTITISAAMDYVFVLPPLEEQKRIVTTIENAFSHLDKISESIT